VDNRRGTRVAVVGASGVVGQNMLRTLHGRSFPAHEVRAVASRRSEGRNVGYGDGTISCEALEDFDFSQVDLVFMAAGGSVSREWGRKIAEHAFVIDNSSQFRMDEDVPLIVPEVNGELLKDSKSRLIANPNCSTAQLVLALKPLHEAASIKRVVVATYQSVSGAGKNAIEELFHQTGHVLSGGTAEPEAFTKQIAFNAIPHIDRFLDDGSTREEWKMVAETAKILDSEIRLHATCARIPVFVGHAEAVNIEFESELSPKRARELLSASDGLEVVDTQEDGGYATPCDSAGRDLTMISRIRTDPTVKHGLSMWVVADNLRKGAALNAVQIAELALRCGRVRMHEAPATPEAI